jgi:hypothetical protein
MLTHDHFSFAVKIHSDQLSFDVERLRAEPLLFFGETYNSSAT